MIAISLSMIVKNGEKALVLPVPFRSFACDMPRAGTRRQAAFRSEPAPEPEKPVKPLGFTQRGARSCMPATECAACYDQLNDPGRAERFNERSAFFQPDSPAATCNREYSARKRSPAYKEE